MTTYTAAQITAIGGNDWTGATGIHRVYLNADTIADMIGLEIERYRTGNIQRAWLNDEKISNSKATHLLTGRVYWEAGTIHVTGPLGEYADLIRARIADKVAAHAPSTVADADKTVSKLRQAGQTAKQIAEMIGVSVSTIYRWARGICRPNNVNAARLATIA